MQEIKDVYSLKIKMAEYDSQSADEIKEQDAKIIVYKDNSVLGYILNDSKISHILVGLYIKHIGLLLRSYEKQNYINPMEFDVFYNDEYNCWYGQFLAHQNLSYQLLGNVACFFTPLKYNPSALEKVKLTMLSELDYLNNNNPTLLNIINNNLLSIDENKMFLSKLQHVFFNKDVPDIFLD
jgi:hypothetical protein